MHSSRTGRTVEEEAGPLGPTVARVLPDRRARATAPLQARRRARGVALAVVWRVLLVTLLLTAFGSRQAQVKTAAPAPAQRLLPAGPPRAQIIALQDTLRIQLPINRSGSPRSALPTGERAPARPLGTQANPGLMKRMFHRFFGGRAPGPLLPHQRGVPREHRARRRRRRRHRRLRAGGRRASSGPRVPDPERQAVRARDRHPAARRDPGPVVIVTHLRADPALTVGDALVVAST